MEQFIGCNAHKNYSVFVAVSERGETSRHVRVDHDRELDRRFLDESPPGSQIVIEASGHYYWIVDEMDAAGHHPRVAHPLEAKKRLRKTGKKTDKVDAGGLGILLRNGTLPKVPRPRNLKALDTPRWRREPQVVYRLQPRSHSRARHPSGERERPPHDGSLAPRT